MFRDQLPRLYELKDLIPDPASPRAYFQDFEKTLQDSAHGLSIYARLESTLQCLDADAWDYLRGEAQPHLTSGDKKGRAWQGLFNILNQAHAYHYLKRLGCTGVIFIPRAATRTPDLEGLIDGRRVLCEVKTLNISDDEVKARRGGIVRGFDLKEGFLRKLHHAISAAQRQLRARDQPGLARHMVYVSPRFDDLLAQGKEIYFRQIDEYLTEYPFNDLEIVMHNAHTPFHMQISMTAAAVDNDPS